MELGEKLATFDIETDTDVSSVYPTDTGRHCLCSDCAILIIGN